MSCYFEVHAPGQLIEPAGGQLLGGSGRICPVFLPPLGHPFSVVISCPLHDGSCDDPAPLLARTCSGQWHTLKSCPHHYHHYLSKNGGTLQKKPYFVFVLITIDFGQK